MYNILVLETVGNCFLEKRISDLANKVAELKQLTTARLLPANSDASAGYVFT